MDDFFKKVKDGIHMGINTVTEKSKEFVEGAREMVETNKLKSNIDALRSQRKNALEDLGQAVYSMYLENTVDDVGIKSKCQIITEFDKRIKEKEEELHQLHLKMQEELKKFNKCECGADIQDGAKFCARCGKNIAP